MKTIIQNGIVISMNPQRRIAKLTIVIDRDKISDITDQDVSRSIMGDVELIDATGMAVLPGFINAHLHGDVLLARGLGDGLNLHEQGCNTSLPGRTGWFAPQFNAENRSLSRQLQYIEALHSGTTFVCDFLFRSNNAENLGLPFQVTGMDGAVVVDYRYDFLQPRRRSRNELELIFQAIRDDGYLPMLQGPSEEEFDQDLLTQLKSVAQANNIKMMLHLAETKTRKKIIEEKFKMSPVRFLNSIGFLGSEIIGSHCVQADEQELEMLVENDTAIVNSPVAEMKIADGIAPMVPFIGKGGVLGLGSDGAMWNDSANIFGEMKTFMLLQRLEYGASALSAYQALEAATIGGATALGIADRLGSIEKGKQASLMLVKLNKANMVPTYHARNSNLIENIVSCAQPENVDTVWVNGKKVIEKGKFLLFDEEKLIIAGNQKGEDLFSNFK